MYTLSEYGEGPSTCLLFAETLFCVGSQYLGEQSHCVTQFACSYTSQQKRFAFDFCFRYTESHNFKKFFKLKEPIMVLYTNYGFYIVSGETL